MSAVVKSFGYATKGILESLSGRNMKIHILITFVVIFLAFQIGVELVELMVILICIGMVLAAEIFNTALEEVVNRMRDDLGLPYEVAGRAKDLSAGAVLICAVIALLCGVIIFVPKLFELI